MNDHDQDHRPDEAALRDRLALDRTHLANERTALAHARTAIMLFVTGGTLLKLFAPQPAAVISGWALVAVGLAVLIAGLRRYFVLRSTLLRVGRPLRASR